MYDSIVMKHLCINRCSLRDESNEIPEVSVANIYHGSNREDKWLGVAVVRSSSCLFLH